MLILMRQGGELNNGTYVINDYFGETIKLQIYSYSIAPKIIGFILIIWGIIELIGVKKRENKQINIR